jgi:hypothetical protein
MAETLGQVWLRRHWFASSFGAAAIFLLASALLTPNLLRVRNSTHYQDQVGPPAQPIPATDTLRRIPMNANLSPAGEMYFSTPSTTGDASPARVTDRKIARTSSMDMVVSHPAEDLEKIRSYAESVGGWVERSEASGAQDAATASLTIQVPSARLEEVKAELRKLAITVESDKTDALDVTRQYVDVQARLRNLRAEESQYLQIMRSAHKVPDMLEVSEKLSEVRGEIEQTQAEFESLSKQVEMVSIAVSMHPQPTVQGFVLNWKPMQQLKVSLHDALDGLADYATAMTAALLYAPVLLLWVGTILLAAFVVWKGLRWTGRVVFKLPAVTEKAAG